MYEVQEKKPLTEARSAVILPVRDPFLWKRVIRQFACYETRFWMVIIDYTER